MPIVGREANNDFMTGLSMLANTFGLLYPNEDKRVREMGMESVFM